MASAWVAHCCFDERNPPPKILLSNALGSFRWTVIHPDVKPLDIVFNSIGKPSQIRSALSFWYSYILFVPMSHKKAENLGSNSQRFAWNCGMQIVLRWIYELGVISIPRSYREERLIENVSIWDFTLTDEDHEKIKTIEQQSMCTAPAFHSQSEGVHWAAFDEFHDNDE